MNKKVEKLFELFNNNGLMIPNYNGKFVVIVLCEISDKEQSNIGYRKKTIVKSRGSPYYSET